MKGLVRLHFSSLQAILHLSEPFILISPNPLPSKPTHLSEPRRTSVQTILANYKLQIAVSKGRLSWLYIPIHEPRCLYFYFTRFQEMCLPS